MGIQFHKTRLGMKLPVMAKALDDEDPTSAENKPTSKPPEISTTPAEDLTSEEITEHERLYPPTKRYLTSSTKPEEAKEPETSEPPTTAKQPAQNYAASRSPEVGLRQDIQQNPTDKDTWKIYADYLEENGDQRSDLIRGMLQWSKITSTARKKGQQEIRKLNELWETADTDFKRALAESFPIARQALIWDSSGRNNRRAGGLVTANEVAEILRLRARNPDGVDEQLDRLNTALDGFGIEAIEGAEERSNYYGNIVALYVNMGDTYDTTLLYDVPHRRFIQTSWGDWVERNQERYGIE